MSQPNPTLEWGPKMKVTCGVGTIALGVGLILVVSVFSFSYLRQWLTENKPIREWIEQSESGRREAAKTGKTTQPSGRPAHDFKNVTFDSLTDGTWYRLIAGIILLIVGTICLSIIACTSKSDGTETSLTLVHLIGIGYAMTILGILNFTIMAGFAWNGLLVPLLRGYLLDQIEILLALTMIAIIGLSIVGALFFIANSLWARLPETKYNAPYFWAGLWFRLGEAQLFALVLLLVYLANTETPSILYIAIGALFVGMFLKSGEELVFGLSKRFFEAFSTLVADRAAEESTEVHRFTVDSSTDAEALKKVKTAITGLKCVRDLGQIDANGKPAKLNVRAVRGAVAKQEIINIAATHGVVLKAIED